MTLKIHLKEIIKKKSVWKLVEGFWRNFFPQKKDEMTEHHFITLGLSREAGTVVWGAQRVLWS